MSYPKNFASPDMLKKATEYHKQDVKNYGKPTPPNKRYKVKKKTGPNQVASHTKDELRRARTGSSGHLQYPT